MARMRLTRKQREAVVKGPLTKVFRRIEDEASVSKNGYYGSCLEHVLPGTDVFTATGERPSKREGRGDKIDTDQYGVYYAILIEEGNIVLWLFRIRSPLA